MVVQWHQSENILQSNILQKSESPIQKSALMIFQTMSFNKKLI